MGTAITVDELRRSYGAGSSRREALSGVSFTIEEGETVALLGVNGAGKTTLTKILSTLLLPTEGSARLFDYDVVREARKCRSFTSVVFGGDRGLYGRLTGRENLRFLGMLAGASRRRLRARVPELLEQVGLAEAADRRVETYSKGMRQRLHIAIGTITNPRILLLDEPTVGLDPLEASRLRGNIRALRDQGVTVLLTSHYLLDVEELAERVLVLDEGRIKMDLPLAEFAQTAGYAAVVTVRGAGQAPDRGRMPAGFDLVAASIDGEQWTATVRVREWTPTAFADLSAIFSAAQVNDVSVREIRLEEAFARAYVEAS